MPSNLRSKSQSGPLKRSWVSVAAIGTSQSGIRVAVLVDRTIRLRKHTSMRRKRRLTAPEGEAHHRPSFMPRRRLVRALFLLGALAACWAIVVMWTGGVLTYVGGIRITSRAPRNVIVLAVVCLVFTWALGVPGHRVQTLAAEYRWLVDRLARLVPRVPPAWLIAGIAAIGQSPLGSSREPSLLAGRIRTDM